MAIGAVSYSTGRFRSLRLMAFINGRCWNSIGLIEFLNSEGIDIRLNILFFIFFWWRNDGGGCCIFFPLFFSPPPRLENYKVELKMTASVASQRPTLLPHFCCFFVRLFFLFNLYFNSFQFSPLRRAGSCCCFSALLSCRFVIFFLSFISVCVCECVSVWVC